MLHGNTKQLHYLVMPRIQFMSVVNCEEKNYFKVDILLAESHHSST